MTSTTVERARKRSFYAADPIIRAEGKCVRIFKLLNREQRAVVLSMLELRFGERLARDMMLVPVERTHPTEPGGGGG
jgi:hypothetical protein